MSTVFKADKIAECGGGVSDVVYVPALLTQPVRKFINNIARADEGFVKAIAAVPAGQIVVRSRADARQLLVQLVRLFPFAPVLVLAASNYSARGVWFWLRQQLAGPVSLIGHRHQQSGNRITIGSYRDGAKYAKQPPPGMLVLLDAEESVGNRTIEEITALVSPGLMRIYAMRQPRALNRASELWLEATLGPKLFGEEDATNHVRVLICPAPSSPQTAELKGVDYKRVAYWGNSERNKLVAAIAHAAVAGDVAALGRLGIDMSNLAGAHLSEDVGTADPMGVRMQRGQGQEHGQLSKPVRFPPSGLRSAVCVLVESSEHAEAMLRQLPGWTLRRLGPDEPHRHEDPSCGRVITTINYAAAFGLNADVIVRADGGSGAPGTRDINMFAPDHLRKPVVLVDFEDAFDARARRQTLQRLAHYDQRRWVRS